MSDDYLTRQAVDRLIARASAYGETLPAEGKMVKDLRGLPVAKPSRQFVCPECAENFGTNPDALGRHIVRHEPFRLVEELEAPVKCPKCKRWLEGAKSADGESDWHLRLCQGDVPLGLAAPNPTEVQET